MKVLSLKKTTNAKKQKHDSDSPSRSLSRAALLSLISSSLSLWIPKTLFFFSLSLLHGKKIDRKKNRPLFHTLTFSLFTSLTHRSLLSPPYLSPKKQKKRPFLFSGSERGEQEEEGGKELRKGKKKDKAASRWPGDRKKKMIALLNFPNFPSAAADAAATTTSLLSSSTPPVLPPPPHPL